MKERAAAAKALKAELARDGGSSGGGSEYHTERRSNPSGLDPLVLGGIAVLGFMWWNSRHTHFVR